MFQQKNIFKTIAVSGLTVLLAVLIIYGVVRATGYGSLTPNVSTSTPTGYTLEDIYQRLNTNAPATAGNHTLTAGATSTDAFHTLVDIYNKIPTINPNNLLSTTTYLGITGNIIPRGAFGLKASTTDQVFAAGYYLGGTLSGDADLVASNVKSGVNIFGTIGVYGGGGYAYGDDSATTVLTTAAGAGTFNAANLTSSLIATSTAWGVGQVGALLGHLFNGTSGSNTGGSQINGGADDYNNGGALPLNSYHNAWTRCANTTYNAVTNPGGNYCNTGDSFASYKDNITGLIWSMPCSGAGCTSMSTSSPTTYHWFSSGGVGPNNYNPTYGSTTASQLCSVVHPGWYLPHQKQLMQAYVDGAYRKFQWDTNDDWSATAVSYSSNYVWGVSVAIGETKLSQIYSLVTTLVCVRSN